MCRNMRQMHDVFARSKFSHGYQDNIDACINTTGISRLLYALFMCCTELMRALMSTLMISLCNTTAQEENTRRQQVDMMEVTSEADNASLDFLSVI